LVHFSHPLAAKEKTIALNAGKLSQDMKQSPIAEPEEKLTDMLML